MTVSLPRLCVKVGVGSVNMQRCPNSAISCSGSMNYLFKMVILDAHSVISGSFPSARAQDWDCGFANIQMIWFAPNFTPVPAKGGAVPTAKPHPDRAASMRAGSCLALTSLTNTVESKLQYHKYTLSPNPRGALTCAKKGKKLPASRGLLFGKGGVLRWQRRRKNAKKPFRLRDAKPPVAQPPLPSYEKTQSETWHTLGWIILVNAFYQKRDYSAPLSQRACKRRKLNEWIIAGEGEARRKARRRKGKKGGTGGDWRVAKQVFRVWRRRIVWYSWTAREDILNS